MNKTSSSTDIGSRPSGSNLKNPRTIKRIQTLSRVVTAIFLLALVWTIYQAYTSGNPVPIWAWLGVLVVSAMVIGLGVAFLVYRGVSDEVGLFDVSLSHHVTGNLKSETTSVETGDASSLSTEVTMMAGELQLMGGAANALDGSFTYDDADWKPPELAYAVDASGQGNLVVKQLATHRPAMRQGRCEWVLHFNKDLPTDLKVKVGAGKASLRTAGLRVRRLGVESGVGELIVDLSGEWGQDMEAFIKTGIGDSVLILPEGCGIRITTSMDLGKVKSANLTWDGEAYTNSLYGNAAANLDIAVEGGIGRLKLVEQAAVGTA